MIIVAADDERMALQGLVDEIREAEPKAEIHTFRWPEDLLVFMEKNHADVAFLDVEMPGMNGVELAEKLKTYNPNINIIFTTGYGSYLAAAFELHASGYLLKPITTNKVHKELQNLRRPVKQEKAIRIQAFGNFEVYLRGTPMEFKYTKTKELLAYLVDRKGALCTNGEIMAVLFEEDKGHETYFRSLKKDLVDTMEASGCVSIINQQWGKLGINVEQFDCDYYDWCNGIRTSANAYMGEYMTQYSWGEFTNAVLHTYQ